MVVTLVANPDFVDYLEFYLLLETVDVRLD